MSDPRFLRVDFPDGKVILVPVAKIDALVSMGANTIVHSNFPGMNGAIVIAKTIDEVLASITPTESSAKIK